MSSKLVSAASSHGISLPSKSVLRGPQHGHLKGFVIALLLVVSFLTLVGTLLVHYPKKVDAFLNSDEHIESKHVVTSSR
jgi:hypothetical protein